MDRRLSIIAIIISIIAIIIAGVAAFSLELNFQNSSFTIGTLTLLVTLLVGWQIYNKIEFDAKVQKAIDKQVRKGANIALFVALSQQGKSAFNRDDKAEAIQSMLNALCVWDKEMETPMAKEAYDYCIMNLSVLCKNVIFEVEFAEEKDAYMKAALKTGNRELIDFVTQIKIRNKDR